MIATFADEGIEFKPEGLTLALLLTLTRDPNLKGRKLEVV